MLAGRKRKKTSQKSTNATRNTKLISKCHDYSNATQNCWLCHAELLTNPFYVWIGLDENQIFSGTIHCGAFIDFYKYYPSAVLKYHGVTSSILKYLNSVVSFSPPCFIINFISMEKISILPLPSLARKNITLDPCHILCLTFWGNKIKTPHASPGILAMNYKTPPCLMDFTK